MAGVIEGIEDSEEATDCNDERQEEGAWAEPLARRDIKPGSCAYRALWSKRL